MEIILGKSVGDLVFGMLPTEVENLYGKPDYSYTDDDDDLIYIYNQQQLRLAFYESEDSKLCYVITSNPNAAVHETNFIGMNLQEATDLLQQQTNVKPFSERLDLTELLVFEGVSFNLVGEFGVVSKLEIGVAVSDKDEFIFPKR